MVDPLSLACVWFRFSADLSCNNIYRHLLQRLLW